MYQASRVAGVRSVSARGAPVTGSLLFSSKSLVSTLTGLSSPQSTFSAHSAALIASSMPTTLSLRPGFRQRGRRTRPAPRPRAAHRSTSQCARPVCLPSLPNSTAAALRFGPYDTAPVRPNGGAAVATATPAARQQGNASFAVRSVPRHTCATPRPASSPWTGRLGNPDTRLAARPARFGPRPAPGISPLSLRSGLGHLTEPPFVDEPLTWQPGSPITYESDVENRGYRSY